MNSDKKEIAEKFRGVIENNAHLLIELIIRGDKQFRIVEVFIDNETGVTTESCAEISRELTKLIDENNLFPGKYRLDVSSPGIDRPLKFLVQFKKHLNRNFSVKYDENKKLEGKLIKINGDELTFGNDGNEIPIKFNQIKSAKVRISF